MRDQDRGSLGAHTNLTDTERTLNILWHEGVRPDHVILGTSFHGQGYTAMESTCLEAGCPYASGSDPHSCSREVGVMSFAEIDETARRTGGQAVLHEDAAVQVLSFDDDQWVAYEDEKTIKMKAEYAQTRCLGGLMAWVSRDTPARLFSTALSQAIGPAFKSHVNPKQDVRSIHARLNRNGEDTVLRHPQCMWTNCGGGLCIF